MNRTLLNISLAVATTLATHGAIAQPAAAVLTRVDHFQAGYQHTKIRAVDVNCMFPNKIGLVVADKLLDAEPMMLAIPLASPFTHTYPVLNKAIDRLNDYRRMNELRATKSSVGC